MSEVRPMRPDEIPEIAELYRVVDRSDWRIPPSEITGFFQRILLEDPWSDPDIPTLVHVEDSGEITGFIGSHVRRMRFDETTIRMASGGPLIAHPKVRNRAVGPRLWKQYLAGPQELTIADGASDEMRQIFELIGGQMMHPSSIAWARVFRPFSFMGNRVLHLHPREKGARRAGLVGPRPRLGESGGLFPCPGRPYGDDRAADAGTAARAYAGRDAFAAAVPGLRRAVPELAVRRVARQPDLGHAGQAVRTR